MNADLYLRQGDTHAICQDYAEAIAIEGGVTLAVCDGCSSSPGTDMGARLLARAALHCAGSFDDVDAFATSTIDCAAASARFLELPFPCLDSTLLIVQADEGHCRAAMFGDGAIAVGYVDGSVIVWSVDYSSNAPDYLSYRLDPARRSAYVDLVDGAECSVRRVEWGGKCVVISTIEPLAPGPLIINIDRVAEPIRWIAAMTDGVKSFTRPVRSTATKGRESVDEVEVLTDLLDFVNVNGKFVERQVRWFAAECEKRGWKHADDLGIAAIAFDSAKLDRA